MEVKVKSWNSLLFLVFSTTIFFSGCGKSDDSTNPNNQNALKGSDYQPLISSQTSSVTLNGSVTYYDSLGTMTNTEAAQGPLNPKNFIRDSKELDKLIPDEFNIGQEWFILGESSIKVKVAEVLANYTSSTAKSYKDAVRLEVTSSTSSGQENVNLTFQKYLINVYLVKGAGIVDAKVENYSQDHTSWDWDNYSKQIKKHFFRKVVSGTIGL